MTHHSQEDPINWAFGFYTILFPRVFRADPYIPLKLFILDERIWKSYKNHLNGMFSWLIENSSESYYLVVLITQNFLNLLN